MTQIVIAATDAGFHFLQDGVPTAHEIFGSSMGLGGAFLLDPDTGEWRTENGIQSRQYDTVLTLDHSLTTFDEFNNQTTITVTGASFWATIDGVRVKVGDMTLPPGAAFQSVASMWVKSHTHTWLTEPFFDRPGGHFRSEAGQTLAQIAQDAGTRFEGGSGKDVFDAASHYAVWLDQFFGIEGTSESAVRAWGEAGGDVLRGGANDDRLYGGKGHDLLDGGSRGQDRLYGGRGNDTLEASNKQGQGPDAGVGNALYGGDGDDSLIGGRARDKLSGGDDNDTLMGQDGSDRLFGGDGNDWIYGGYGHDVIDGGTGADQVFGDEGNDSLRALGDHSTMFGGSGRDQLAGADGQDILHGDAGHDTLIGNAGNDLLYGGGGRDSLYGGDGDDLLSDDPASFDRNRLFGGSGADTLESGAGSDKLHGGKDADVLIAYSGDNQLFGGKGRDTLIAGTGMDSLTGGIGNDRFVFSRDTFTTDVTITDFELATDKLVLTPQLWWDDALTRQQIVAQFAEVEGDAVVFRFAYGATVTLQGVTDLTSLHTDIVLL